ncbi:lysine--tRNA ligase [Candidatus Dependentiae bacterium]|nr:lysine--tRNA ligase [Candidatus Dependentiae bacterium]
MESLERNALIDQRINKIDELKNSGTNPYPYKFIKQYDIKNILDDFDKFKETDQVVTAGRIMLVRLMGKAAFAHILDNTGKIQIYVRVNDIGKEMFEIFKKLDIGDIIGITGKLFKTHSDEKTIHTSEFVLLSKSIRPLPEKFHGLRDTEMRYRQRYVDLIMNENVKDIFIKRSKIVGNIRKQLNSKKFLEVETPMMQPIAGGAAARPFITHHNTLDLDLYLRIAPELYLKRLLVGGLEKVYEINRNFRNEGISTQHNPEFTMLELYSAYDDYNDMMNICEEIIYNAAVEVNNSDVVSYGNKEISLKPPFKRVAYYESINEILKTDVRTLDIDSLKKIAFSHKIELDKNSDKIAVINELFENLVEPNLFQPTFIYDYPVEISPLTKRHRTDPSVVERFELFIANYEIANAYSELNDPIEQYNRFCGQLKIKELTKNDEIADKIDFDYIRALEYGMPPAGGLGIGIDRLVMVLTGVESIREVILFPQLRQEQL